MNLDECDRIFAQVHGASSPSEVCHALEVLFEHYQVINIELNRGAVFWRGRKTEEQRPWATLAQIGYPQPEIAKANRLNDENTSCLSARVKVVVASFMQPAAVYPGRANAF